MMPTIDKAYLAECFETLIKNNVVPNWLMTERMQRRTLDMLRTVMAADKLNHALARSFATAWLELAPVEHHASVLLGGIGIVMAVKGDYIDPEQFDAIVLAELTELVRMRLRMRELKEFSLIGIEAELYNAGFMTVNDFDARSHALDIFRINLNDHLRSMGPVLTDIMQNEFHDYIRMDWPAYHFINNYAIVKQFENQISTTGRYREPESGVHAFRILESLIQKVRETERYAEHASQLDPALDTILAHIRTKDLYETRWLALYYMLTLYIKQGLPCPVFLRSLRVKDAGTHMSRVDRILSLFDDVLHPAQDGEG